MQKDFIKVRFYGKIIIYEEKSKPGENLGRKATRLRETMPVELP